MRAYNSNNLSTDGCSPTLSCGINSKSILKAGAAAFCAALIYASPALAAGPSPVKLGQAGFFVILSASGIQDVYASAVKGNVGVSPITGAANHLTCTEVTGRVFSVDAAGPAPCSKAKPALLLKAIGAMTTAYNDAASRTPDTVELGAGNIGGLTIAPGTYNWSSNVIIPSDVTLHGKARMFGFSRLRRMSI